MYVVLKRRTHTISIFVHEIDQKQNEVAPDWFKIEEFSATLSNKFNSEHWKTGEMLEVSIKSK